MRVRNHKGWGHGLRPGTDSDICCETCRRESREGIKPNITGTD